MLRFEADKLSITMEELALVCLKCSAIGVFQIDILLISIFGVAV